MKTLSLSELKRRFEPGLALTLLLTLFAAIPLLSNPGLSDGADTRIHIFRAAEMTRSWQHGEYLPSWAEGMYYGYGSPLFHFYARLAYFIAALLQTCLGMDALNAMRWLLLLCFFIGSGGMYLFCIRRSGRLGGLIAGLAYVYSPIIVFTLPYTRGAFPEILAYALFPLLLWRVDALRDRPTWQSLLLVVALQAALINAHNLMAAALTAVALAWVAFETLAQRFNREASQTDPRGGAVALLALLLGVLAAASFWLPILLESDSVNLEQLLAESYFDYQRHFLALDELLAPAPITDAGAFWGPRPMRSLGNAQWGLALAGAASALLLYVRGYPGRRPRALLGAACFTVMALAFIYLITSSSLGIWQSLRPMHFLQFPWRLLGPCAACLAVAASLNGLWLERLQGRFGIIAIALIVPLPIVSALPLLFVPDWDLKSLDASVASLHRESDSVPALMGTTSTHEFLPRHVLTIPTATAGLLRDYADGHPIDRLNRARLPAGASATLLQSSPQSNEWLIHAEQALNAEVFTFYWLGWRAEADGRSLSIEPGPTHGMINISLPAGDYKLRVYLGSTPARELASAISALAIILLGLALWRLRNQPQPPRPHLPAMPLSRRCILAIMLGGGAALLSLAVAFREGIAWINSPPGEALPAQHRAAYSIDDSLQLIGYSLPRRQGYRAGDVVRLDLFWYARDKPEYDFRSFLHLAQSGLVRAQIDKLRPGSEGLSVLDWPPTGYIFDRYELTLPHDLPAGDYELVAGLWHCEWAPASGCVSSYRPAIRDDRSHVLGHSVTIAKIQVDAR